MSQLWVSFDVLDKRPFMRQWRLMKQVAEVTKGRSQRGLSTVSAIAIVMWKRKAVMWKHKAVMWKHKAVMCKHKGDRGKSHKRRVCTQPRVYKCYGGTASRQIDVLRGLCSSWDRSVRSEGQVPTMLLCR
jgi:hypothetical protein